MRQSLQHFLLWRKLRWLNKRYTALIEQAKHEGDPLFNQHLEEQFWYETAVLLEEKRRLQISKNNPHSCSLPSPKPLVLPKSPIPLTNSPLKAPYGLFIVLFSVCSGISLGVGIFWLLVPQFLF